MRSPSIPSTKGIRISALFLGLYFVMLPFDFYRVQSLGSVSRLLAYIPIGFSIMEQLRSSGSIKLSINNITKSGLFLIIVALLSIPFSVSQSVSSGAFFTLFMNLLMIFLIGSASVYSNKEVSFLETCLVLGGWLTGVLMLSFSSFSINRMMFQLGDSKQDPNYMCGFMLFAFCFHLRRLLQKKKRVDICAVVSMIILVIMSGSRGSLIAFLVALISSVLTSRSLDKTKKRKAVSGIVMLSIAFVFLYIFVLPNINSAITDRFTLQYLQTYGTIGRTDIWEYLIKKFWNSNPVRMIFGYGYGTTYIVNDMAGRHYGHVAHNVYIEMLISAGILGLIAEILLHVNCIKEAVRAEKSEVFCTLLAYITMGFSLSLTSYKPQWALMILLLIYSKRRANRLRRDSKNED